MPGACSFLDSPPAEEALLVVQAAFATELMERLKMLKGMRERTMAYF
jgi:hypothetical protein